MDDRTAAPGVGWDRDTPIFNALLREWRDHHRAVPEPPISALSRLLPPRPRGPVPPPGTGPFRYRY